jgi:hypothetical protein
VDLSGLKNGTAYRFSVEARNGFAEDGGVSGRSDESNSVTPYTKPAAPSASTSTGACTAKDKCPITFKASAGGGDGGAGNKTLQVKVDGGSWQDSGESYSKTIQGTSGSKHSIEARVVTKPKNAEGGTATMTSSSVTKSATAKKWVPPPTPTIKNARGYGNATGESGCTEGWCYYIDFTVSGLEPNTEYTYCIMSSMDGGCWFPTTDGATPVKGKFTTNSAGEWGVQASGHKPYWGHPNEDVWVYVESGGKSGESNKVQIGSS